MQGYGYHCLNTQNNLSLTEGPLDRHSVPPAVMQSEVRSLTLLEKDPIKTSQLTSSFHKLKDRKRERRGEASHVTSQCSKQTNPSCEIVYSKTDRRHSINQWHVKSVVVAGDRGTAQN